MKQGLGLGLGLAPPLWGALLCGGSTPVWGAPPLWGAPLCGEQPLRGELPWLGWLACGALPWLGLAWACLACLALAWSSNNNNSGGAAAAGRRRRPVVVAGPGQGKAVKTGPGQTKPGQGTTSKPAKPRQPFWTKIRICFFTPNIRPGRALGALAPPYFHLVSFYAAALWGAPPVHFTLVSLIF